ncbi:MAG: aminoacyl-tRNA deacylase [Chloroflexi bacterium]|nr:MAG: aminoacyl-tRNA deacylase [Chloroflexota bacterium]
MEKTLAMKFLEGKKIRYEAVTYPNTIRDAVEVAAQIGVSPEQVFKTLVVKRPSAKPMLVIIPANRTLDLKKLAQAAGVKKLKMATHQEAEEMTGLQVGGISPLLLINKGFDIYLDVAAQSHEQIYISAGQRGINLKIGVADLLKVTRARWVNAASS